MCFLGNENDQKFDVINEEMFIKQNLLKNFLSKEVEG